MRQEVRRLILSLFFISGLIAPLTWGETVAMVFVPGGSFQMGDSKGDGYSDEIPVHTVTLDSFYMGKYEVTNGQYCQYLNYALGSSIYVSSGEVYGSGNNQLYCDTSTRSSYSQIAYSGGVFSVRTKGGRNMSNDPMVQVSWYGSVAYCNWRSQQEGKEQCYNLSTWVCDFNKHGYRLATEAEWEYAARGGLSGKRFPWGDTISHSQANYKSYWSEGHPYYPYDVSPTQGYHPTWNDGIMPYTSPVGSFSANGFGVYDMTGNVWEWCNDRYSSVYYSSSPPNNPTGPTSGIGCVLRSGSWIDVAPYCRVAYRGGYYHLPYHLTSYYGFRVVLDSPGTSGTLTGTIRDGVTGNPIADANVNVPEKPIIQTNGSGQFSFSNLYPGQTDVSISKNGYYSVTQTVTINSGSTTCVNISMTPQAGGTNPVVVDISNQYCNQSKHVYYLNGISLNQIFTVTVDWKGHTPGIVRWTTPTNTYETSCPGTTVSRTFNVGSEFGIGGRLTVIAIASDSAQSASKTANFDVIPSPPGIPVAMLIPNMYGNSLSYNATFGLGFIEEGVGNNVIPAEIPGFGGRAFKFNTTVSLSAQVSGSGTASATITPGIDCNEMEIAGVSIKPTASVSLNWQYSSAQQKWLPGGSIQVGITGEYSTLPSYYVIPVGPVPVPVYWRTALETALGVQLALTGWNPDGRPILLGQVPFEVGAEIMLGVGVADVLAAEGYLGGSANMLLEFPNEEPLQQLSIELNGGVRITVFIFKYENNLLHYEWQLVGGEKLGEVITPRLLELPKEEEFKVMGREYLTTDYAVWVPSQVRDKKESLMILENEIMGDGEPNEEQIIQTNVFSQSQPAIAADGNDFLLAWIYDDPNRTSINRTELIFSKCVNGIWSQPSAIDDDNTADFSPQIVALGDGNAVCVWENVNKVLSNDVNLSQMASAMDIKAGYYDSNTGVWTIHTLTDNNHLDHSPRMAADNNTAMAVWIYNEKDDILGTDSNALNEIRYSRWNGTNWSEPNTAASNVGLIIKTTLAYDGNRAAYVYVVDPNWSWNTEADREIYAIIYDGNSWSTPDKITDDNLIDANPQIVYDENDILLIWYRDGNLVSCCNFDMNNVREILPTVGSSGAMDFRLAKSPNGQISLVWNDTSAKGVDIFTATYDPAKKVWSSGYQLTSDRDMERSIAAVYAGTGELALAYNKVRIVDVNGVPEPNRVDLCVLRHIIKGDLSILPADISSSIPNPQPGTIVDINAVVHNLGDIAEVNVPVVFYNGDPDANGVQIGNTQIIAGPIPAAGAVVASVQWLVPEVNEPQRIYVVVDPNFTKEDAVRSNNTASILLMAPDLTVAEIRSERIGPKMRAITACIANTGDLAAQNASVVVRRDAINGPVLGDFNIPVINASSSIDVSFDWNIAGESFDTPEIPVYVIVDEADAIAEFSEQNNTSFGLVWIGSKADITDDGAIDFEDLIVLASQWLQVPGIPSADIAPTPADGIVNFLDFAVIADHWLEGQ
jgi:formylglycine-generating enzyme required for sulfatase activity